MPVPVPVDDLDVVQLPLHRDGGEALGPVVIRPLRPKVWRWREAPATTKTELSSSAWMCAMLAGGDSCATTAWASVVGGGAGYR